MAEFKLERFRYTWKGVWTTGTAYRRDDIARVNGNSYVCLITHTASAAFRTDLTATLPGSSPPQPLPKWKTMTEGNTFVGDWLNGTDYNIGDIVNYDGSLWVCTVPHAGTNFATNSANWAVFTQHIKFVTDWLTGTTYGPGALAKYNGIVYKCITANTAGVTLETNIADWEIYHDGIEIRNDWAPNTEYRKNDLVKYGATVFRCITTHTSNPTALDDTNFIVEVFGTQYDGNWSSSTYYNIGDVVRHRGFVYYAITNNYGSSPYNGESIPSPDWIIVSRGTNFVGPWSPTTVTVPSTAELVVGMNLEVNGSGGFFEPNTKIRTILDATTFTITKVPVQEIISANVDATIGIVKVALTSVSSAATIYKTGDIVSRGGNLYTALRDIAGDETDGSTLDYIDTSIWELFIPGKSFKSTWAIGNVYALNDVAYFKGSSYTCNFEHTSSILNYPGDNGNVYDYWDTLVQSGSPAALQEKGDLLTYGLSREIDDDGSTIFDESTFGDAKLSIGSQGQLLTVSEELAVFWSNRIEESDTVYVSLSGIDDVNRGSYEAPFRTIRYAAEYIEDNFTALDPTIIRVATGKYEEIGPIIVPAGCAVNGDELRSTSVLAAPALPGYQNDYDYVIDYLEYFGTISFDILSGNQIVKQPNNTTDQSYEQQVPSLDENGKVITDLLGAPVLVSNNYPEADTATSDAVTVLASDFKNYIDFRVISGDVDPAITGSNTASIDQARLNGAAGLLLNDLFLQEEIYAYLTNQYPAITFDKIKVKNDVHSLIRGLSRDIKYSGNYSTILAARRYSNAVGGSQTDSLFFLRDTTGLRDCTTGGLRGTLNPPGVFELYQKPTGGALVSLDPGWGPDDRRTWIVNRSPYIQGVTNTGFGCVGMKVDGALHNGGNKSMTANDFTQVLSDGIGAWITNNGRAELVSVFTYYCQIGYFAEDGGIIRATNGNNSYGRYGSVADGIDATEVPQEVSVFNRNHEATVVQAISGGASDEVLIFEYSNTGEEYTEATADIVGAGADATVEFTDFRDGALFQARLASPDGSSNKGGAGYVVRQGSAQETLDASSSLILSINDTTQEETEIAGMRIIITDGTGVGQYARINSFNFASKTVTVIKDSDLGAGWDHVIAGTPLVAAMDQTTRYRIEPLVTITAPDYSSTGFNVFTERNYVDAAYGGTTATYSNLTANSYRLWLDDNLYRITLEELVSDTQINIRAAFAIELGVPISIRGRTTGTTATILSTSPGAEGVINLVINANGDNFTPGEEFDLVYSVGSGDTFDDVPVSARFRVVKAGSSYTVSLTNAGAGYDIGDKITILGTLLGGTTPSNDLYITVTGVSDDSSSTILTFTTNGSAFSNRFVSLIQDQYARWSNNGQNWFEVNLPFISSYKKVISGNNRFIAISNNNENRAASSLTGEAWTTVNLPTSAAWTDGVYGGGKFVLVAQDTDVVASSTNGITWTSGSIPNDAVGDSTISIWSHVTYGKGKYLAVSSNDRATATSTDGETWVRHDQALPDEVWATASVAYGNNRFLILSATGTSAYSFDGITWIAGTSADAAIAYSDMKYGNGLFVARTNNSSNQISTTEDGLIWTLRTLSDEQLYGAMTVGKVNGVNKWLLIASGATTAGVNHVNVGAQAKVRSEVTTGSFKTVKIWDPGSGYVTPPGYSVVDPNFTSEVAIELRTGNGAMSQPDFINRGAGYRRNTSTIKITGDGFADFIPDENIITLTGVRTVPGTGVQIEIAGVLDVVSEPVDDLFIFSGVIITDLGDDGSNNSTRLVQITLSPSLETYLNIPHGALVTFREKYSQCRISGHDFLDIGTGNFVSTNYPSLYSSGAYFVASPENEVFEANSGRVYYVSTDQDGNFRTGELFSIQQATGIVTISAQFFNLEGLSQLALGGVRLGGSGTVVNEFSTDGTFSADSNNVIPTQRAIATFLADRLSVGGEALEVNKLQAGRVVVGGAFNELSNAAQQYLYIDSDVIFDGTFESDDGQGNITVNQTEISGTIVSQMLLFKGFDETMQ